MPVDRMLWTNVQFSEGNQPGWPCPKCRLGTIVFKQETLAENITADSKSLEDEFGPQASSYEGRFVCLFICSRRECGEPVAVTGVSWIDINDRKQEMVQFYSPTSFSPSPSFIIVPNACPEPIRHEVKMVFSLFWHDIGASLNRVRVAVELLLTEMGIKKTGRKKDGSRTHLGLQARIDILRSKKPKLTELCDRLLAVKHLGNAGSHPGEVQKKDVFDGLDILEHILSEKYAKPESDIAKMVRQINKRKGPRK